MKTKIVYTVISGKNDMYLPQALIAGYSARLYNPSATIILVVDTETASAIDETMTSFYKYFDSIIKIEVPREFSKMQKSRYLKTTLRHNIVGDFLYIDTDTVVTCDLSSIDDCPHSIAAVLDRHSLVSEHELKEKISKDISFVGMTINDLKDKYFNGGVMYVKDNEMAHIFYDKWHSYWDAARKEGKNIDQPPLAKANKECGYPIEEIDGTWNCQLADNFINYLQNAKVLHYFASDGKSPYLLNDARTFQEVMKVGDIPSWLKQKLESPKCYFIEKHFLAFDEDIHFLRTNVHTMYIYHRWIFNILEFISKNLIYISKIIK